MKKINDVPRLLFGIFILIFSGYGFLSDISPLQLLFLGPIAIWYIFDSIFLKKGYLGRAYNPGTWSAAIFLGTMIVYTYVFQPVYAKNPFFTFQL